MGMVATQGASQGRLFPPQFILDPLKVLRKKAYLEGMALFEGDASLMPNSYYLHFDLNDKVVNSTKPGPGNTVLVC